uniref:Uncharacterized protein n=2 Tax=Lutzomyia longipalpis TaxID=7200 RepID=A0A1B0CEF0_LUTLO
KRRGSISAQEVSGIALLAATANQLRKPNQQLLIPITIFIGMEQAFIGADFTQIKRISGIALLAATANQLRKPNQQLLIPITIFIGMEQAFIGADFTQAYVSCAIGIHQIGYVMICFGVVNAVCSIIFGSVMKYIGRIPIIILGIIAHGALFIVLLFWRPHPEHMWVFFTLSGLWGVGDAVWQTQINGIYGALFRRNKEAAFSNYRLWESAGFVIAYAYSTTLCARMKLYVMISVMILGIFGWIVVEIKHWRKEMRLKKLE